jgi:O-acetyl-ADP-ribose deacetylase (regulator of RNase III)
MTRSQQLDFLIGELLPGAAIPKQEADKWMMFRSLVNLRRPGPLSKAFLPVQDDFLQTEIAIKGITRLEDMQPIADGIYVWQGDITTLAVDAIVNAANSGMTGCYCPCHGCIDNAIHTFAGAQLRNECAGLMAAQGYAEPIGQAKITGAYNLPSRHVIHTVGPTVNDELTVEHREELAMCYHSCLKLADENNLDSIAFCCISTGEFHFPNEAAAEIAINEVANYVNGGGTCKVVFNVFSENDYLLYTHSLCR